MAYADKKSLYVKTISDELMILVKVYLSHLLIIIMI